MFMVKFVEFYALDTMTERKYYSSLKAAFNAAKTFHPTEWWVRVELFRLEPNGSEEITPKLLLTRTEGFH